MELKHFELKVGRKEIQIPYYELVGKKSGRFGFVAGGVRGDDINSLNILRNFVRVAKLTELEKKISGVLLIFPALNLPAVKTNSRFALEDGLDLFKEFGSTHKTLTQTLAYELTHNFFKKCDFGIVFMDSRSEFDFLPNSKVYMRDEHIISDIDQQKAFGVKLHLKSQAKNKMMPVFLRDEFGTQINIIEVGSKKEVSTEFVKSSMNGIRNILSYHGMLSQSKRVNNKQTLITSKMHEKSKSSGILNLKVSLGDTILKGDKLGTIYNPVLQKEFPIISGKDGVVYAIRNTNLVAEGQILYYVLPMAGRSKLIESRGFKII